MRDDLVGADFFDQFGKAVGRLESAAGRVGLIRDGFASPALRQGELVYQGDVIEAGADGSATIRLLDGTTFHLSPDSSIAIGAFDPAEDSSGPSSVKIVRGKVGFFPGRSVRDGRLNVETPSAAIRGTSLGAGAAISAGLAALFILCLVEEANAASEEITILDFDDITFKDLHHGTFEVITKGPNPQVFIVDDPGQTLVLHPRGSGFSIEIVANTRAQMLDLQNAYKSAYDIFSLGSRDPFFQLFQRTASGVGSGGSLDADGFHSGKFGILIFAGLQQDGVTPALFYRPIDQKSGDAGAPPTLVTIPATVHLLPISRFQIGEVDFSPNISITFPPTYEHLISVTFQHVPAGYIIKDGNGHTYSGPSFTILAADYYSGLTLTTPASGVTEAYLEISARVSGLGGEVDSDFERMPLTLDLDPTGKVEWHATTGLWETDSNWSTGVKPLPTQDVVIESLAPTRLVVDVTSTTDISLNSLRLDASATNSSVTLHIAGGHFSINAADNDPFSNKKGTVQIENGASFTVGNAQHPGQLIVNSGVIEAISGLIVFIAANVTNATGRIQIDAPSTLNLQDTTIASGDLINHGLIKVSTGATNSIHDLGSFVNDGELLITGSGTTLQLSNETLNNVGGLVTVDPGAILNLTDMTIAGGKLSGTGEINVIGDTKLDGSSGHAVTIDTGTAVTVHTGTTLTLDGSIQGGGEISVAGASAIVANGTVLVPINAAALADDTLLTLSGTADLTVTNLKGDLTATLLSGDLDVTVSDVADLSVATGSGANIIDARALASGHVLNLSGAHGASVSLSDGDLDAHTDTGALTVEVVANGAASSNTITTGSNDTDITGDELGDNITVDATALTDGNVLTLDGQAEFTVTHLKGDLDASGLSGTLDVTTDDIAGAGTIDITTGSNDTSITAGALLPGGTADDIAVHAAQLADGKTLTLAGPADFTIDHLIADLNAAGLTGTLDVTTTDIAGAGTIDITTGSNDTGITAGALLPGDTADDITVHAVALADGKTLTLAGPADFTIDHLVADLDAASLSGTLDVTTTDIAGAGTIDITTGSNDTSITAGALLPLGTDDDIAVHAAQLADGKTLTLAGPADFTIDHLVADLNAASLTGALDVTTADIAGAGTIDITIGSNDTGITAGALPPGGTADDIAVHAAALADGKTLTLAGPADFTIDHLVADLNAAGLSGTLDVTTTDIAGAGTIDITTGSNDTSITAGALLPGGTADDITVHAAALADGKTLTLAGPADFTIDHLVADLNAAGLTGTLDVTTTDIAGAGTIDITTGSNDTSITAGALLPGGTADDIAVHAAQLADGKTLTLAGPADFTVDHLAGDLDASGLSGDLDVTTADVADLSITTGSGANTIDATALAGTHVLNLDGNHDASVSLTDGDLDAHTDTGVLTVEVLKNNAVSTNTVTTGSNDIRVSGEEAHDDITVDATALADGNTLTLDGQAEFTVTHLKGDLEASGLTGTLDVTTDDIAGAGTIDITTGSNDTSITAGALLPLGTADDIAVHAAQLADGKTLTLAGPADFTVDNLVGDLDAKGLSGDLDVTTADVADLSITTGAGANTIDATALAGGHTLDLEGDDDASVSLTDGNLDAHTDTGVLTVEVLVNGATSANTITTGSNDIHVTGDELGDDITVDATALADGNTLTLDGKAQFTVSGLAGDLDATHLTGDLDVTTADVADLSITTGAGANTIDAAALAGGHTLDLDGDHDASVSLTDGNLDAHTDTGVLTVEVLVNGVASTNTITTGSNDIHVTGDELGDNITVDATTLADGNTLTLDGPAKFAVSHLKGDLDASGLSGDLAVTTANVADLSITTGSGTNTIDATALTSGHTLDLEGNDDASITLGGGDLDAHADTGKLTVEVVTNGAASFNTITTGSNDTHVTGDELQDDIAVDATALADGNTLTLDGQAQFTVTHLKGDLDASGLSGDLDVTTANVVNLSVTTGSGVNTINARALTNNHLLRLKGTHDASVSLANGDLNAATDTGVLTVEVVANGAASSNTITTGSNGIHVTGDEAQDSILVNATALADGKTLTLDGPAQLTVTNLKGDLDAAGLTGTLDVTTADIAGAGTVDITTGSNDTGITAGALLPGGTADDITVHASALADGKALTLAGPADFTVDHLAGDLDAKGVTGSLDVSTVDVADLSIRTGSGTNTIDATALTSGHVLNLSGDYAASVSLKDGDLDATADIGSLTVEIVANGAVSSNTITTGSNDTHITGDEAHDDIQIDAAALADGKTLTLDGLADFTVTSLKADLDATGLSGRLFATVSDVADLSITTGSGINLINAMALAANHVLELKGDDGAGIFLSDGNLDAATDTGHLFVEVAANGAASTNTITTGQNNIQVTGDEALDHIQVDATNLADGKSLDINGFAAFTVTHLQANLDAADLSGSLDVTTSDAADLIITTGSGTNTIDATALADDHFLRLKGDHDASVTLTDGNLSAATDTGALTIEVAANGAASSNVIVTGSNDIQISGDEAADTIRVNAVHLAAGKTLTLDGQADFIVKNLGADLDATALQGDLKVAGTSASNIIVGGSGNDVLDGNGGGDTLTGGLGQDKFVFAGSEGTNTVTDFAIGQDRIVLDGIFTGANDPAFQAFLNSLHSAASGVHDINIAGTTIVLQNVDVNHLHQSDFVVH